jgi:molybdate transport system ATP-binding protein
VSLLEFDARLRYPSNFTLDARFSVERELAVLFGPSGSGKTSILSMIAGLRHPDYGRVRLQGKTLVDVAGKVILPPEQRHIGYVFQDYMLFPHLSVQKNLAYGWKRRPKGARPMEFERVVAALELTELTQRLPHTLSGGQKQRVALGRAILAGPELLLLDEPLAAIDEELRDRLLDYVERVLEEWRIPTLYVTHNAGEAARVAQQVISISDGRIVETQRTLSGR